MIILQRTVSKSLTLASARRGCGNELWRHSREPIKLPLLKKLMNLENLSKRSIFQTFWKVHCVTKPLFFEIETSNFGSSYVFSSPLKWWGQI